jgi:hypothetical protein
MIGSTTKKHRLRLLLGCAAAFAVFAAPAPAANDHGNVRADPTSARFDERVGASATGSLPLDPWAVYLVTRHSAAPAVASESSAFAWGDAGVGAAGALAAVLLTAGVAAGIRKKNIRRAHA